MRQNKKLLIQNRSNRFKTFMIKKEEEEENPKFLLSKQK